jgi:hypothetical protein
MNLPRTNMKLTWSTTDKVFLSMIVIVSISVILVIVSTTGVFDASKRVVPPASVTQTPVSPYTTRSPFYSKTDAFHVPSSALSTITITPYTSIPEIPNTDKLKKF